NRVRQQRPQVAKRQVTVGVHEPALQDLKNRPEKKRREKRSREHKNEAGKPLRHRPKPAHADAARDSKVGPVCDWPLSAYGLCPRSEYPLSWRAFDLGRPSGRRVRT